ncbi:unnamed protein product [Coccothraustes coccothraustes]
MGDAGSAWWGRRGCRDPAASALDFPKKPISALANTTPALLQGRTSCHQAHGTRERAGSCIGAGWGEVRAILQAAVPHVSLACPELGRLPAGEAAKGPVMATTQSRDLAFYAAVAARRPCSCIGSSPQYRSFLATSGKTPDVAVQKDGASSQLRLASAEGCAGRSVRPRQRMKAPARTPTTDAPARAPSGLSAEGQRP